MQKNWIKVFICAEHDHTQNLLESVFALDPFLICLYIVMKEARYSGKKDIASVPTLKN